MMKKLALSSAIALSVATSTITPAFAQGIPVYDATAVMKMIEQATAMANQLVELKNQVKALTDFKGFAEELTGIGDEINSALNSIQGIKDSLVSGSSGGGQISTAQGLNGVYADALEKQMKKIEEISQRIASAPDTKAMSEIQAEIGLRQQAMDIMKEQKALAEAEAKDRAAKEVLLMTYVQAGNRYKIAKKTPASSYSSERYAESSGQGFDDVLNH